MTTVEFARVPAIEVEQPIGVFYAAAIPAHQLLTVCYTDTVSAVLDGASYRLAGHQRPLDDRRLSDIGRFIGTNDFTFPNSIILAANYDRQKGSFVPEPDRWYVERSGDRTELVIPTDARIAPIIDGQHRLFGFTHAAPARLDMPVLCSVFIGLPRPYQAYLFATVNSTQKSVSRSQTFELFGYNLEEERPDRWSPEKLAVFLGRKLNTDDESPFYRRILVAAHSDFGVDAATARRQARWMISMATFVDGVTRLISTRPRRDDDLLRTGKNTKRSELELGDDRWRPPMRELYLRGQDRVLMASIRNFFDVVMHVTSGRVAASAALLRTVGIQALFDVLRLLAPHAIEERDVSAEWFEKRLEGLEEVDFSEPSFMAASGQARTEIRTAIWDRLSR